MELKNIRMYPIVLSPVYPWVQGFILGAWGLFFIFLLGSCLEKGKYGIQGILIVSFAAIFAFLLFWDLRWGF